MCAGLEIGGHGVEHRGGHLAGHGALPDQLVELGLVGRQVAGHGLGRAQRRSRAHRFVRFLRVLALALVVARLGRQRVGAELADDGLADLGDRFLSQAHRVGTHVADEADGIATEVHTFIQLLRRAHGAARGEAELAVGFLLQGRGGERRRRIATALLLVDAGDCQRALSSREDALAGGFGAAFVGQRELLGLLAVELDQLGRERLGFLLRARFERPVFLRHESHDLGFALADQAQRRRLHAAGRQARLHLAPEQRRQVEADQIIERTTRLLGVDEVVGDIARVGDGIADRALGDFVEHHALHGLALERVLFLQQLDQMPGNGFAFAIRVGGQEQRVGVLQSTDDRPHVFLVAVDDLVFHLEIGFRVDRAVFGHQVAHVSVRSEHFVILAEVLLDRLGLGR